MNCRNCQSIVTPFFSMGKMPLVNSFMNQKEILNAKKYELTTAFCQQCYLVQLTQTVPPEELFRNYLYFSSTSSTLLNYFKQTANYLVDRFHLKQENLVLEIASNDGAMLQCFKDCNVGILGVDPAKNIAEDANKRGIKTLPEFFNFEFAKKISAQGTMADLVYGANVLAHVPEINDFVKGVKQILKPEGSAIFEFHYLKGLFENKFDIIYHEHVFYYSLIALQNLFKNAGLAIYDVEMAPMQGGSLRIFAAHPGIFQISHNVNDLAKKEIDNHFDKIENYQKLGSNIGRLKDEIVSLLKNLKKDGKHIAAYSAPAKGVILLNYFGIKDCLDFIVDKSPAKQGLYTPGVGMQVFPVEKIYEERPDYLLVLCWNIYEEVIEQLKNHKNSGGKFIVPIPEIKII